MVHVQKLEVDTIEIAGAWLRYRTGLGTKGKCERLAGRCHVPGSEGEGNERGGENEKRHKETCPLHRKTAGHLAEAGHLWTSFAETPGLAAVPGERLGRRFTRWFPSPIFLDSKFALWG